MSTQNKIIAARRIVRLLDQKEALEALLKSNDVMVQKCIKINYNPYGSVSIDGAAFDLICTEIQSKINQINHEIYDTQVQ